MKKNLLKIAIFALIFWAIFSLIYIGFQFWKTYEQEKANAYRTDGYKIAIQQMIAESEKCTGPIPVHMGEKKVFLVNTACPSTTSPAITTPEPTPTSPIQK